MREFSKKGISDVVTTVLIILLVLAAVVIVWSFVRPQLENTGTAIDAKTKCLTVTADVVSCNKTAFVTYSTSGNPTAIKILVVNNTAGTVNDSVTTPSAAGSKQVSGVWGTTQNASTATVAVVVKDTNNAEYTCDPITPVTCA